MIRMALFLSAGLLLACFNPELAPATHSVTYFANGATGGQVPVDPKAYQGGRSAQVADNSGLLVNPGYLFAGWTTNPSAAGPSDSFAPGSTAKIGSADLELYAVWIPDIYAFSSLGNEITMTTRLSPPPSVVVIPPGVTSIKQTYYNCQELTDITLPSSTKFVFEGAFSGCANLARVTLPAEMQTIERNAFDHCSSLTAINLPAGLLDLGDGAFFLCTSLQSLTIPPKITRLKSGTFAFCSNLTTVGLPEGLQYIESYVFQDCHSLTSVNTPATLLSMGMGVFNNCIALQGFTFPSLPHGIPAGLFQGCSSLTSITLPANIVTLGLGSAVFKDCSTLNSVTILSETPPPLESASEAFAGVDPQCKINVPSAAAVTAYQAAVGWNEYASMIVTP